MHPEGNIIIDIDEFGYESIELFDKQENKLIIGAYEMYEGSGDIKRAPLTTIKMLAPDKSVLWEVSKGEPTDPIKK